MYAKVLLSGMTILALAGCAAAPQAADHASPGQGATAGATTASASRDAGCVSSATRLPGPANCRYPGNSYSLDDLQQTGQPNAGPALRMLDPAISGH
jgi:uncharacterized protein YceK